MHAQSKPAVAARFAPLTLFLLAGCATRGAPAFVLFGSFFPGWLFCAVLGVAAAIAARIAFVALKLSNVLPFQLFVCSAIGLSAALLVWLVWFEA
jgi:hypothetical protein